MILNNDLPENDKCKIVYKFQNAFQHQSFNYADHKIYAFYDWYFKNLFFKYLLVDSYTCTRTFQHLVKDKSRICLYLHT